MKNTPLIEKTPIWILSTPITLRGAWELKSLAQKAVFLASYWLEDSDTHECFWGDEHGGFVIFPAGSGWAVEYVVSREAALPQGRHWNFIETLWRYALLENVDPRYRERVPTDWYAVYGPPSLRETSPLGPAYLFNPEGFLTGES